MYAVEIEVVCIFRKPAASVQTLKCNLYGSKFKKTINATMKM